MNHKDAAVLSAACEAFADTYTPQHPRSARSRSATVLLDAADRNLLRQKIALLPERDRALLLCRYGWGLSAAVAGRLLEIAHPQERLDCCEELLRVAMGLWGGIDHRSLQAVCRRGMGQPKAEPKRGRVLRLTLRRLAVAAAAAMLTATVALGCNVPMRAQFFQWTVNSFPEYSQIGPAGVTREPTQEDFERLKGYKPGYIPKGYVLEEAELESPWIIYDYGNGKNIRLYFNGSLPTGDFTYYNTEDAVIETLIYLGQPAFYWEKDDITYFVWQQDGFQFDIMGNITKEEALKMAESTNFKN